MPTYEEEVLKKWNELLRPSAVPARLSANGDNIELYYDSKSANCSVAFSSDVTPGLMLLALNQARGGPRQQILKSSYHLIGIDIYVRPGSMAATSVFNLICRLV